MSAPGLGCVETIRDCWLGYEDYHKGLLRDLLTVFLLIGAVAGSRGVVMHFEAGTNADLNLEAPRYARIAAISGLMPMMFMTRVRL